MAHAKETREQVRRAYVFDQQSLEMAAKLANVPLPTARRWKDAAKGKGDDWDKTRAAAIFAGGSLEDVARSILAGFLLQYRATIDEINTSENIAAADKVDMLSGLADAFSKTVASSKKVLPETNQLATAMEVIQLLSEFVQQHCPQHLSAFLEILEPFGTVVQKRYS